MPKPFVSTDNTFAGHGLKSLTCEVTPAGMAFLFTTDGGHKTVLTLTPGERARLIDALSRPGTTTEIAEY